jgi:hypothetical protein
VVPTSRKKSQYACSRFLGRILLRVSLIHSSKSRVLLEFEAVFCLFLVGLNKDFYHPLFLSPICLVQELPEEASAITAKDIGNFLVIANIGSHPHIMIFKLTLTTFDLRYKALTQQNQTLRVRPYSNSFNTLRFTLTC